MRKERHKNEKNWGQRTERRNEAKGEQGMESLVMQPELVRFSRDIMCVCVCVWCQFFSYEQLCLSETNQVWQQSHTHTKSTCFEGMPFDFLLSFSADVCFGLSSLLIWWVFHGCGLQFLVCTGLCVVLVKGTGYFWCSWLVGHAEQSLGLLPTAFTQISHILLLFFSFHPQPSDSLTFLFFFGQCLCNLNLY